MGFGRSGVRLGLALAICAAGCAALGSQALAGPNISASVNGQEIPVQFKRGTIRSDGNLTVGQQETITVKKFPPGLKFQMDVEPSPFVPECQNFTQECIPQPIYPMAGTPAFRTKRKGRATVTFVMPSAYELFDDLDPTASHSIKFVQGQAVHLHVEGESFRHKNGNFSLTVGEATGRAVAEVPATP